MRPSTGFGQPSRFDPVLPVVLMNLGVTLSDLGAFDEALGFIRESLRLLPDSPESHVNLGNTLARQGNWTMRSRATNTHSLRPDFPVAQAVSCLSLAGSRRLYAVGGPSTNGD